MLDLAVDFPQLLAEACGGSVEVVVVVDAIVVVDVLQLFVGVDVGLQVARDRLADDLVVVVVLGVRKVGVVEHLAALLVDHAAVHDVLVEVIPVQSQVLRIVQVVHVIIVIKVNVVVREVAGVVLFRPRELVVGLGLVEVRHHELLPLFALLGQDLLLLEAFELLLLDDVVIVRLHVFVAVGLLAQHRAEHQTIFEHSNRMCSTIINELLATVRVIAYTPFGLELQLFDLVKYALISIQYPIFEITQTSCQFFYQMHVEPICLIIILRI